MSDDTFYYVKRQTNAGRNQGKWRVYCSTGGSIGPACDDRRQALHIAMAFNLAEQTSEGRNRIFCAGEITGGGAMVDGPLYPKWRSRR